MGNSDVERRTVALTSDRPTNWYPLAVLVAIPAIYAVGGIAWLAYGVQLTVVVGCSSVVAWGVLLAALFLAPPTA